MTAYHASNDYGVFHFVMGQPDQTALILAVTIIIILVGAYLILKYVPAPHR